MSDKKEKHKAQSTNGVTPLCVFALCFVLCISLFGCQAGQFIGALAQSEEYQKLVDTPPKYAGLENKTAAILVQADMTTLYEYPDLVAAVADGVSRRLQRDVPGTKILAAQAVLNWQYRTPQWNALPHGELAEQLNVDRIVLVDLLEYRLNPPGNRYLWEGVCVARVGIIERGSIDPDAFAEVFDISVKYPRDTGVDRQTTPESTIQFGLRYLFIEKAAWLFHQHLEPKYPDKYRPELDTKKKKA